METYRGVFRNIKLGYRLDVAPKQGDWEWNDHYPNYPTVLAYLEVYLDGNNAAEQLPSAFLTHLVIFMLINIPKIINGGSDEAIWMSDPWKFDITGIPETNQAAITLHLPGGWAAMDQVVVPLDQYCREVIRFCQEWSRFIKTNYSDEVTHPEKGKIYHNVQQDLRIARKAINLYSNHRNLGFIQSEEIE